MKIGSRDASEAAVALADEEIELAHCGHGDIDIELLVSTEDSELDEARELAENGDYVEVILTERNSARD